MTCGIYLIKHKFSGLLYVGQARNIEARWARHLKGDTNRYLKQILVEEGKEAFEFTVLEEIPAEDLNARETYWIAQYNTMFPNGLNLTAGGKVPDVFSPELKAILSAAQKKRWQDPERRQKQADLGRVRFSDPNWLLKTIPSPESRRKISDSMKERTAAMNRKRGGGVAA